PAPAPPPPPTPPPAVMLLALLFWTFFRISLLSLGGGYNMIPLMQRDIAARGWLTDAQFVELLALSETTPGPLAVNAATLVGYRSAGLPGALAATTGVCLPGTILVLLLGAALLRHRDHPAVRAVLRWMPPVLAGLIAATAFRLARSLLPAATLPDALLFLLAFLLFLRPRTSPAFVFLLCASLSLLRA
ncbi:MAG: chromate transporter, partial [Kiritimatiellae bacterium]|nr:chromate transporter [Kiritimatiellia bacterium]